ncbi:unnamed protein product [Dibothriocephalus latus]|uniref:DNA replication factor RFC1 C-terminal domain-containing protein n=1 Tax=Dibothriocephalus latus TaxID=60516 RepID=A0A3P7NXK2_DIBLA|nr:unnamed protein product [Dibothriocephalus latus]
MSELSTHLRLSTHGGASDGRCIMLDYVNPFAFRMTAPLKEGDIDSVLGMLNAYQLLREDMDNILELSTWKGRLNPMKAVDSKVLIHVIDNVSVLHGIRFSCCFFPCPCCQLYSLF